MAKRKPIDVSKLTDEEIAELIARLQEEQQERFLRQILWGDMDPKTLIGIES